MGAHLVTTSRCQEQHAEVQDYHRPTGYGCTVNTEMNELAPL
jgi:hypothetical protein